jgi:hypothetical protein
MFEVRRLITSLAALAIVVGLPLGSQSGVAVGAAPAEVDQASPTVDPMAPSFFTGTTPASTACPISVGTTTHTVEGVIERRDASYGCFEWHTDDPRINGTSTVVWDSDEYPETVETATGRSGTIIAIRERIENDAGAWEGTETQLDIDGTGFSEIAGWFTGEGAYEGLLAYVVITDANATAEVWGFITPRERLEPPAFPDP